MRARARFLSLFFLSFFLVRWCSTRRDCATEREREKDLNIIYIFKISYPLLVLLVVVVGLNKDEFYLEHDHHPCGVVAAFDATSKFVDEYYE